MLIWPKHLSGVTRSIHPIGTPSPGSNRLLKCTIAPILTTERSPSDAPLKIDTRVAIKTFSATVHPVRCACGPIKTLLDIESGWRFVPRKTAFSIITHLEPMVIGPVSAVSTAPKPTDVPSPILTSPQITAVGAIRAVGSMVGTFPLCSMSMTGKVSR